MLLKVLSVGNPPRTVWGSMGDSKALLQALDQCPKQKSGDGLGYNLRSICQYCNTLSVAHALPNGLKQILSRVALAVLPVAESV